MSLSIINGDSISQECLAMSNVLSEISERISSVCPQTVMVIGEKTKKVLFLSLRKTETATSDQKRWSTMYVQERGIWVMVRQMLKKTFWNNFRFLLAVIRSPVCQDWFLKRILEWNEWKKIHAIWYYYSFLHINARCQPTIDFSKSFD